MLIISFIVAISYIISWYVGKYYPYDKTIHDILTIYVPISILLQCSVGIYCYLKRSNENGAFCLIPNIIDKYVIKDNLSEIEKKTLIVLLLFPLFVVGCVPLYGFFILLYAIPFILFIVLVVGVKKIYFWITNDKNKGYSLGDDLDIKDYYLILDVPQTASPEEIDSAFNKTMARQSAMMAGGSNKEILHSIQEAYRVLSSSMIRPLYDEEYYKFRSSLNPGGYVISNKYLCKLLKDIRGEISGKNEAKKITLKWNVVIVSLIVMLLSLIPITYLMVYRYCKGKTEDYYNQTSWTDRWENRWNFVVHGKKSLYY